jgi:NAD+ synthase (glutamine-hydrolysing)
MKPQLRIVLAQLNFTVGDLAANVQKHLSAAITARDKLKADVIVFPELSLCAYSPEDLLLRKSFIEDNRQALQKLIREIKDIYCLIGHPKASEAGLFNQCSLIFNGQMLASYAKQCLPNYGVFDESRYFTAGTTSSVLPICGIPTGFLICEDLWRLEPLKKLAAEGAALIVVPNASPFEVGKQEQRLALLSKRASSTGLAIAYVNAVGGQDDLLFDGGSMMVDAQAKLCQRAACFQEALLPVDITLDKGSVSCVSSSINPLPSKEQSMYQALVLSLRDYVEKNHFKSVIVGLSGGIDSALTLTIAVDALGKDRVHGVMMPSRYSTAMSLEDAHLLADTLQVQKHVIPIEPAYQAFLNSLPIDFNHQKPNVTLENIQTRVRAIILMALSNQYGHLVLSTGNRSELAVGYCTLYGDMAGGFCLLKDVLKTEVYQLAHYRNSLQPVIPKRSIERAPSAELAPDQKDEDSLPPYSLLDQILNAYLEQGLSQDDIIAQGFDHDMVVAVIGLIKRNEYKRKQAVIGTHLHHKSFGRDWRYPLTNGWKG